MASTFQNRNKQQEIFPKTPANQFQCEALSQQNFDELRETPELENKTPSGRLSQLPEEEELLREQPATPEPVNPISCGNQHNKKASISLKCFFLRNASFRVKISKEFSF